MRCVGGQMAVKLYIQMLKEKTISQELYIQQNYPSKDWTEMKTFPDKQKLRGLLLSIFDLK